MKLSSIDHYLADPAVRRKSWQERLHNPAWSARPNAAHTALVTLERAGRLTAIITQNIDGLHQRAGSDPGKVIELEAAAEAAMYCKTFITIGTSLTVHPAAGLADVARRHGARLVILNNEETPSDALADEVIREPIGEVLPAVVSAGG